MKKWTSEELSNAIILHSKGLRYVDIGKQLHRTYKSVKVKLLSIGLKENRKQFNITIKCLYCNNHFIANINENRIFCSQKCAASYNNKKREKKSKHRCLFCGKTISRKNKFCSNSCYSGYKNQNYLIKWKNGEVDGLQPKTLCLKMIIRKYIFEKYDYKCHKCGWNEINPVSLKSPLQIEHIDGNYLNCKEENLDLLCPNCHSLTSTFGFLNRGNGRYLRRLRYKNGQSR
jgi:predicted nucleic acid-binding Zn ribbon protein